MFTRTHIKVVFIIVLAGFLTCFPQPAWIFGFFVAAAGAIAQDFVAGACQTACSGDLPSCGGFRRAAILPACF